MAAPRCSECRGECPTDRTIYLLEVIEPAPQPGRIVQLCSARCVHAWSAALEASRNPPAG